MDNTNFQTIHQMGNAINNVVRQATGRDNVQNIDMDYVTVAQRKIAVEETATGNPATFETNAITPMKLLIPLAPIQDLNGYDYPWPEGGGKNLYSNIITTGQAGGCTFTQNEDKSATISGSANSAAAMAYVQLPFTISAGTKVTFSLNNSSINAEVGVRLINQDVSPVYYGTPIYADDVNKIGTVTSVQDTSTVNIFVKSNHSDVSAITLKIQLEIGEEATEWTPYSNICPISGWTGVNVTVSPTLNEEDGTTYSIVFPSSAGTVYGGTLTVNEDGTGTLVADMAIEDLGNKTWSINNSIFEATFTGIKNTSNKTKCEILKGIEASGINAIPADEDYVICPRIGRTTMIIKATGITTVEQLMSTITGYKVCYELATPVKIDLTELEVIETLLGTNNIWADTGDVTVMYKNYEEVI